MAYRVLALDGGGSWALLQAQTLEQLYPGKSGHEILAEFNLVAANSGGSIVLGGLIKNLTPRAIIDLFRDTTIRRSLFTRIALRRLINRLLGVGPKYSTERKRQGLAEVLGSSLLGTTMRDLNLPGRDGERLKVVVIGFDYDQQRASFFRSYPSKAGPPPVDISLLDAIHASSTAPVNYFDTPTTAGVHRYWDGGIGGYNNPLMAAVVEAIIEGAKLSDIQALSLGTGTVRLVPRDAPVSPPDDLRQPQDAPGLLVDIKKLAVSILDDPPDAASYVAYITLGNDPSPPRASGSGSLIRLSPCIQPVFDELGRRWSLPPGLPPELFKALNKLELDATEEDDIQHLLRLGQAWIRGDVPNQPVRLDWKTLDCAVGDPTFPVGAGRWRALTASRPAPDQPPRPVRPAA